MSEGLVPKGGVCLVCSSTDISIFFETFQVPVHCNVFFPTRDEAIRVAKGDIRLGFCKYCGHVFNLAFQSEAMKYDAGYENSLHFSPRFQAYAIELSKRLIDCYDLHNKEVLEIGCGKGDFLDLLCELGGNRGVGFDSSYDCEPGHDSGRGKVTFVKDFYSPQYADYKADCICCRHVLEHIQSPREFLKNIYEAIGNHLNTILFFEVPNGMFTLRDLAIWDVIYEHCSYFCPKSLKHLFTTCGFDVSHCAETFEGQFLTIEAFPRRGSPNSCAEPVRDMERMGEHVATFRDRYGRTIVKWQKVLEETRSGGKRVVLWGAGSKGVTFLNAIQSTDQIEYVVDINPHKQRKYIAGGGQKVVAPDFLKTYRPDVVIVMNSIYRGEIQQVIQELGLSPEFLTC